MKRNYISPLTENIQLAGETMMDSFNIMTGSGSTFNDMTDID
jgi:hypothetical protein